MRISVLVVLTFAMLSGAWVFGAGAGAQENPGEATASASASASAEASAQPEGGVTTEGAQNQGLEPRAQERERNAGAQDVEAQVEDASGIPAGTPAIGSNPSNPAGNPDLITIEVSGCTVAQGATIALEDDDGTEARFKDGKLEIEITADATQVTIEGPDDENMGDHATFPTSDTSFDTDGDYRVVRTTGITGCEGSGGGGGGGGGNGGGSGGSGASASADATADDLTSNDLGVNDVNAAEFRCEDIVEISRSASRDQYDFSAARLQECLARDVIDGGVKGRLADTGGPPLLPIAAFLLVGAGIFVGRAVFPRRDE